MVYHPGKVLKVFPSEGKSSETAATIRFWDTNLHTVKVAKEISSRVKEGNVVLVDYYPASERFNRPNMVAVKIVNRKDEKELWTLYQQFLRTRKAAMVRKQPVTKERPFVGVG